MTPKDAETLDKLFRYFHDTLVNHCRRKEYSVSDSEEFVAEAFYRLTKNIDKVTDRSLKEQRAWLYSTVGNVIREHNRKNKFILKDNLDEVEYSDSPEDVCENISMKNTCSVLIKDIYEKLEDDKIEFLEKYEKGEIIYSEIAEEENMNYNTVKSQSYRKLVAIRKAAQEVLEEHGIEISTFKDLK